MSYSGSRVLLSTGATCRRWTSRHHTGVRPERKKRTLHLADSPAHPPAPKVCNVVSAARWGQVSERNKRTLLVLAEVGVSSTLHLGGTGGTCGRWRIKRECTFFSLGTEWNIACHSPGHPICKILQMEIHLKKKISHGFQIGISKAVESRHQKKEPRHKSVVCLW